MLNRFFSLEMNCISTSCEVTGNDERLALLTRADGNLLCRAPGSRYSEGGPDAPATVSPESYVELLDQWIVHLKLTERCVLT